MTVGTPTPYQIARELDRQGLQVLPAAYKSRSPIVDWTAWQDRRTSDMLTNWFGNSTTSAARNYWVMTGHMSAIVVLDCDNALAEEYWRQWPDMAAAMDVTTKVQSRKGIHYWFRLAPNESFKSWRMHPPQKKDADGRPIPKTFEEGYPSFDIQGDGVGVIVPPSVHESGHVYTWITPLSEIVEAPDVLQATHAVHRRGKRNTTVVRLPGDTSNGPIRPVSRATGLAGLLSSPPAEGGRNVWLAETAGHHAKTFRLVYDVYLDQCRHANALLHPPLDEDEFLKTVNSIWETEQRKSPEELMNEKTGWLAGTGNTLSCLCDLGNNQFGHKKYANFDIFAEGIVGEGEDLSYVVTLVREDDNKRIDAILPVTTLADYRKLSLWLFGHRVSVAPPLKASPDWNMSIRLQRYLESQGATTSDIIPLGYDSNQKGFITHDGIITATGLHPFTGPRPDPRWKGRQTYDYHYGFEHDEKTALDALSKVATFFDEETASVHLSMCVATLIKQFIMDAGASWYPIELVRATSESGKSTGFFPITHHLFGSNALNGANITAPALRNLLSATSNGIVWWDDPGGLTEQHWDLVRNLVGGRSAVKMGPDNMSEVSTPLRASLLITGEGFHLGGQKALLDRAIRLNPPSASGRLSLTGNGQSQWDDVLEFMKKWGGTNATGLRDVSGWIVRACLANAGIADQYRSLCPSEKVSGRHGMTLAVPRVGARLLAGLTGDEGHVTRVDGWVRKQLHVAPGPNENVLSTRIMPWALRYEDWPTSAIGKKAIYIERDSKQEESQEQLGERSDDDYPVLWVNLPVLAELWSEFKHGQIAERTETEEALTDQARAVGIGGQRYDGRKPKWVVSRGGNKGLPEIGSEPTEVVTQRLPKGQNTMLYWKVNGPIAESILRRSRGLDEI